MLPLMAAWQLCQAALIRQGTDGTFGRMEVATLLAAIVAAVAAVAMQIVTVRSMGPLIEAAIIREPVMKNYSLHLGNVGGHIAERIMVTFEPPDLKEHFNLPARFPDIAPTNGAWFTVTPGDQPKRRGTLVVKYRMGRFHRYKRRFEFG